MSPSESELRSFLRGGEGEPLNPDALIAHARGVRHTRRVRLASVAAAVIAVGAIGTGAVALRGGDSGQGSAAGNIGSDLGANTRARGGGASRAAPSPAAPSATPTHACPAIPLHLMLPGGGGTGQFGGDEPLFDGAISSMQVCGYAVALGSNQPEYVSTTVLTGDRAAEVATSLNAASPLPVTKECPSAALRELIIYATSMTGVAAKPVVVNLSGCVSSATNGTAARYDWSPPQDVAPTIIRLTTPNPALPNRSGGKSFEPTGSPVR